MESIYYAVKVMAAFWILMVLMILLLSGIKLQKSDRSSKFLLMITLSFVLPIIKYTVDSGDAAPGAFSWGFPVISYIGFFLIALGFIVHLTGIFTLKKQWSPVVVISEGHKLVDYGIYKYIRHPIYAGLLLEVLGFGLALANWAAVLVLVIVNAASLAYRIYVEETALIQYFGESYLHYARKTKRLIPGLF